jgi:hypothetical protein
MLPTVCAPPAGVFEEIPVVVLVPPGCAGATCPPPDAATAGPANSSDAADRAAPIVMANFFNGLLLFQARMYGSLAGTTK